MLIQKHAFLKTLPVVVGQHGACYQVLQKFEQGSFGMLFEAVQLVSVVQNASATAAHERLVVKVLDIRLRTNAHQYLNEVEALKKLSATSLKGFSELVDHGDTNPLLSQGLFKQREKFIVMKKLGPTLHKIFNENSRYLRQIDVLKLGICMVKLVQKLHSTGYLHLDIKTNNILFGCGEEPLNLNSQKDFLQMVPREAEEQEERELHYRQNRYQFDRCDLTPSDMHLIDFGSSVSYLDAEGSHLRDQDLGANDDRNIVFSSKNYFAGTTLTRRDDIISIAYNLLYLMNPHSCRLTKIVSSNKVPEIAW